MTIWKWTATGLLQMEGLDLNDSKPTIIKCGGGLNVDDPAAVIGNESAYVSEFFDFATTYIHVSKSEIRTLFCGPLEGKLVLGYFILRKLLGTISANPEDANYAGRETGGFCDSVDIIDVSYTSINDNFDSMYGHYESADFVSSDARRFAELLFAPLLDKYYPHNLPGLYERLSLITLFGVSYGSCFIIEVENALRGMLVRRRSSEAESADILARVFCIAISNMSNVRGAAGPRFSGVYFEGANDRLAEWMNPHKVEVLSENQWRLIPLGDHRCLIVGPVPVHPSRWIETIPDVDYEELNADSMGHYIPFYTMRCLPHNPLPSLVETVFAGAVRSQVTQLEPGCVISPELGDILSRASLRGGHRGIAAALSHK